MGERATGLNGGKDPSPRDLEHEIDGIRGDLDDLVGELDRRRHEALDWRLQLRRHQREVAIAAGAAIVLIAGAVLLRRSLRRRRDAPLAHAQRLWHAMELAAREPDAFARAVEAQRSRPARTAAGIAGDAAGALLRAGLARAAQSA